MKWIFTILVFSCAHANAQTNGINFEDKSAGFSLRMPTGWVEFPKDVIHQVAGFGAKLEPTPPPREFRAVFQRGTSADHPSFPRVVVHVQNGAPVGEQQFRGLHAAPLIEITVAQSLGFPGRPQFMKSARYDLVKQCLVFNFDCYIEDSGFIHALGRSFLTAEGLVNIYCYAPAGDFNSVQPEFEKIVSTFQLSPEHRYHPGSDANQSPTEKSVAWKEIGWVLGLMAVAGIGWIVVSRMRNNVCSDEI